MEKDSLYFTGRNYEELENFTLIPPYYLFK